MKNGDFLFKKKPFFDLATRFRSKNKKNSILVRNNILKIERKKMVTENWLKALTLKSYFWVEIGRGGLSVNTTKFYIIVRDNILKIKK